MAHEIILIVEDNPTNLKLAKLILNVEGYQVYSAIDANEAAEYLKTSVPDLILMDLQLPGKNGLDFTQELKSNSKYKDIIIIALTAYAMKGDAEKARAAGCDGFITKPISVVDFPVQIAKFLKDKTTASKEER
jgi:two-component system cell cycle response regulator DivK